MSTNITMSFEEFCNECKRYFEELYPEAEVVIKTVMKNNGTELTGLCVKKGEGMLPIIYLDKYWKTYRHCPDLPGIFKEIDKALSSKFNFPGEFSKEDLGYFDKVKDWICMKVINREKNKALLETIPYLEMLDLAVVFYIYLGNGASILITDALVRDTWQQDPDVFVKEMGPIAVVNTNNLLPCMIFNMVEFVNSIAGAEVGECMDDVMYIMTNPAKYFGAAGIATEFTRLKHFAEVHKSGFYILPSSVHELILIPSALDRKDTKSLYRMVREVNNTVVDPEDILSDNVYYFNPETNLVEIAL